LEWKIGVEMSASRNSPVQFDVEICFDVECSVCRTDLNVIWKGDGRHRTASVQPCEVCIDEVNKQTAADSAGKVDAT
jgi:hypothetical protein